MTDLNYGDIQKAVRDGMANFQDELSRLENNTNTLMHSLQNMQNSMGARSSATVDQRLDTIQDDLQELKTRFSAIEQFARQMSDYLQAKFKEEQEDQRYRRV